MRNLSILFAGLFLLALAFSCQPVKQDMATGKPVTLETRTIQQNKGTDCDKQPDSLRTDCAIIDFTVPKIQGTSALSKSVDAWADKFLIHLLTYSDYPESDPSKLLTNLDAAIKRFHAIHDEAKGSVASGQFKAACTHGELLNDGKYLTLMLDGYSFQGGNHALEEVNIATFDLKTGKQLTWADLVNDQKSLLPIAQAKVEASRADAFKEGFKFDKEEPFALPAAYGLTADGLLMHYQPDEIYQLGGATEFTIPYSELGKNLKATAPIAPATETSSIEAADFFEVQGDSLVIPPFEIEVMVSAKAAADLKKRKENIIVSANFWGEPLDPKEIAKGEEGEITVLNKDIELTGSNRIARFEGLKFHKDLLKKMNGSDLSLLINVFSARKTTQDNLLSCGIVDAKASNFRYHRFLVGCPLISEDPAGNTPMTVAFALPDDGSKPAATLPLVVDCTERGEVSLAGAPMKDMEELKANLKTAVAYLLSHGYKNMPEIQTQGCLMGMQGAIRDTYEELKNEAKPGGKKPAETTAPVEKSTSTASPKTESNPVPASKTTTAKPALPAYPAITLNEKGDMTLNGKKLATFEDLRKQLQPLLLTYEIIPDDVPIKTTGTTGMGTRGEMHTQINDAIAGAKWLRKKAAIAAVTAPVSKKMGTGVELVVGNYQTSGNFAYFDARPNKNSSKADAPSSKLEDKVIALLQYSKGAWKVLDYKIGVNAAPVDTWVKTYKAPKGLFGSGK